MTQSVSLAWSAALQPGTDREAPSEVKGTSVPVTSVHTQFQPCRFRILYMTLIIQKLGSCWYRCRVNKRINLPADRCGGVSNVMAAREVCHAFGFWCVSL